MSSGSALLDRIRENHRARQLAWHTTTAPPICNVRRPEPPPMPKPLKIRKRPVRPRAIRLPMFPFVPREVTPPPPTVFDIQKAVAKYFHVPISEIKSARRTALLVRARHVAFLLCRQCTTRSWPEIGRLFKRDHSTIIWGARHIAWLLENGEDEGLAEDVAALREVLK